MATAAPNPGEPDDFDPADNWKHGLEPGFHRKKKPVPKPEAGGTADGTIPKSPVPYLKQSNESEEKADPAGEASNPEVTDDSPVKNVSARDTFYLQQEKRLLHTLLCNQPVRPVRSIAQIKALERRYEEGAFKPGMVTPGCVSLVRLTNWTKDVTFDVIRYDEEGMLTVKVPFARFYLTAAMWQETDKLVEHYVYDKNFLWPINAVEIFPGFTMDEDEDNILLDSKNLKQAKNVDAAWEYFEDTCIKGTPHPPFWTPTPDVWKEQLDADTEWMRKYVFNHIWDKIHRSDKFVRELFLCPKDPVFMGSDVAYIDPTAIEKD